jgi:hypothetical protein
LISREMSPSSGARTILAGIQHSLFGASTGMVSKRRDKEGAVGLVSFLLRMEMDPGVRRCSACLVEN